MIVCFPTLLVFFPGDFDNDADDEAISGVYFDKLELELNAIEQAMSQFEGRLDSLREQAQELLQTLQKERLESQSEEPDISSSKSSTGNDEIVSNEKGSGDV